MVKTIVEVERNERMQKKDRGDLKRVDPARTDLQ
jgi:hypothetical protein